MQKTVLFESKAECCGCEACVGVCPAKAISMKEDEYGFRYPVINDTLCVGCGLCKKTCANRNCEETNTPMETYAACTAITNVMKSASGGAFAGLARRFIEQGGVVFGVSMENVDGLFVPMHISVDTVAGLEKLQGSKYVQSVVGDAYVRVKNELEAGKKVLFSGTPCQVAALKGFLGNKANENLLLVDIVCHGVPSLQFFQSYIKHYEDRVKGKVTDFRFRDKARGWGLVGRVEYIRKGKKKSKLVYARESSYYQLFLRGDIYRESCYECKYACENRPGDITVGDYWGIEREHPELLASNGGCFDQMKGISCLIINSSKGKQYIDAFPDMISKRESTYEKVARQNGQLRIPTSKSGKREEILNVYAQGGYKQVDALFKREHRKNKLIAYIIDRIPTAIKKKMRRLLK